MAPYDLVGNICVVKFPREMKKPAKLRFARSFLKEHPHVTTVVEKTDRVKGRLRTPTTRYILGVKTKEARYYENNCVFRLNVDTCYFSPRLASERAELAQMVKKGENVLVMFGGVGPFAVVIAKRKNAARVVSVELNRACQTYARENVKLNKVQVEIVQGDVRKKVPSLGKFDRIVMARPNLEDSFLDVGFKAIKRGGIVHYYGFYPQESVHEMSDLIKREAKKARRVVKITKVKRAGDIGVRTYRYRADIKVVR